MSEIIMFLDAGKDALQSQTLHCPEEVAASPCPETPNEWGSRGMRESFEAAQNRLLEEMTSIIESDRSDRPPMFVPNLSRSRKIK